MTDTELDVEVEAQQIAAGGRNALVARLRGAYVDAAAAHSDVVSLDGDRIDALVQEAADHADGLQWRRALADVASDRLGISVAQALSHPAVIRAQSLVGAPSYEDSVAELGGTVVPLAADNGSVPAGAPAGAPALVAEPEPQPASDEPESASEELESVEADDVVLELLPEPDPIEMETQLYEIPDGTYTAEQVAPDLEPEPLGGGESEVQPSLEPEPVDTGESEAQPSLQPEPFDAGEEEPPAQPQLDELRVNAVHLGGVANLPTRTDGLDLRVAGPGLDILQSDGEIIGRLVWEEIDGLEVPHTRSRRRRQHAHARLVVRTPHGDASFEVPGFTSDELRDRIEPLVGRYGRH